MQILKIIALLVLFGITLFFAVILTVTVGAQDFVQFVLAWAIVFVALRLERVAAYVLSGVAGAFLAIPASMYIYLPEQGGITLSKFFWQNFVQNFSSPRGFIGLFAYVFIMCASQYLMRSLGRSAVP